MRSLRREKGYVKVFLGRDFRVFGVKFSVVLFVGIVRVGCVSFDMGFVIIFVCFMSIVLFDFGYDGLIMVINIFF